MMNKYQWLLSFFIVAPFTLWAQLQNDTLLLKHSELITKSAPINFQFINQKSEEVKQNSRLELGLTLPDAIMDSIEEYLNGKPHHRRGLNPFVSWDIDIKANFHNSVEDINSTAIGFWYEEMNRNEESNSWDRLETKLPFRIRYAPSEMGKWSVNVEVYVRGKLFYTSRVKEFIVVPSNFKGKVSLNPKTNYLEREGKTIVPIGANLPFPYNKNNLLWNQDSSARLQLSAWEEYAQQIKDYIAQGGAYFRMFLDPSGTGIEFEEVGNYQRRQTYAWEMDQIIRHCEKTNTLIHLDIMYQVVFMKAGGYSDYRFDYSNYWNNKESWPYEDKNYVYGYSLLFEGDTPSDMFLNPLGMTYLKQRTRYIMARWGYSPSISIIELMSEPWHMNENPYLNDRPYDSVSKAGDTARKAVYEYHKQISSYIKDSIGYKEQLLSAVGGFPSGSWAIYSHQTSVEPGFIDSTWYLDNIDVITISHYSRSPSKLLISKSNENNQCGANENSMACPIQRLEKTFGKPVLFGESDTGDGSYECSDYQGVKIDIMRYPYTGAIGHFAWSTFIHKVNNKGETLRDDRKIWPAIIDAKNHFNSDFFISVVNKKGVLGRQKIGFRAVQSDIKETGYIIGKDKNIGAGYIYNRTFNLSTASNQSLEEIKKTLCYLPNPDFNQPLTITWKPQPLKVDGLQRFKKYRLSFYGYTHHQLIRQVNVRSSFKGKLKIKHPPLVPKKSGLPLIWYQIEKVK